jgi:hypothetical protein
VVAEDLLVEGEVVLWQQSQLVVVVETENFSCVYYTAYKPCRCRLQ